MKSSSNTNTILMVIWAILFALKDDIDGEAMSNLMQSIGAASGLSVGFGPLAADNGHPDSHPESASDYVYGIRGLADYLGVSDPTAQKLVNSGKLDSAMRKVGRKYSFRKAKVDEIFSHNNK